MRISNYKGRRLPANLAVVPVPHRSSNALGLVSSRTFQSQNALFCLAFSRCGCPPIPASHKPSQAVRLQIRLQKGFDGLARSDEPFYGFPRIKSACREFFMQTRGEGKIGRTVITIALIAAVAVIVLAIVMVISLTVRRHLKGASLRHREVHLRALCTPFLLLSYTSINVESGRRNRDKLNL